MKTTNKAERPSRIQRAAYGTAFCTGRAVTWLLVGAVTTTVSIGRGARDGAAEIFHQACENAAGDSQPQAYREQTTKTRTRPAPRSARARSQPAGHTPTGTFRKTVNVPYPEAEEVRSAATVQDKEEEDAFASEDFLRGADRFAAGRQTPPKERTRPLFTSEPPVKDREPDLRRAQPGAATQPHYPLDMAAQLAQVRVPRESNLPRAPICDEDERAA